MRQSQTGRRVSRDRPLPGGPDQQRQRDCVLADQQSVHYHEQTDSKPRQESEPQLGGTASCGDPQNYNCEPEGQRESQIPPQPDWEGCGAYVDQSLFEQSHQIQRIISELEIISQNANPQSWILWLQEVLPKSAVFQDLAHQRLSDEVLKTNDLAKKWIQEDFAENLPNIQHDLKEKLRQLSAELEATFSKEYESQSEKQTALIEQTQVHLRQIIAVQTEMQRSFETLKDNQPALVEVQKVQKQCTDLQLVVRDFEKGMRERLVTFVSTQDLQSRLDEIFAT